MTISVFWEDPSECGVLIFKGLMILILDDLNDALSAMDLFPGSRLIIQRKLISNGESLSLVFGVR